MTKHSIINNAYERKLAVLDMALEHAKEIFLEYGYVPDITFDEYEKQSDEKYFWEFNVNYNHNDGTGDIGCSFDTKSL